MIYAFFSHCQQWQPLRCARFAYKLEAVEIIAIFWLPFRWFLYLVFSFILVNFSPLWQTLRKRSKLQRLQLCWSISDVKVDAEVVYLGHRQWWFHV